MSEKMVNMNYERHWKNAEGTYILMGYTTSIFNPLRQELNPSAQRWLTRFFTWDFAS
jgi:hypothetical protein